MAPATGLPVGLRVCRVCRGPVLVGHACCYQCEIHRRVAGSLLADAVMPIGYAVKGSGLASDLWRYKACDDVAAAARLGAMLRDFQRDHGDCVRRAAGMTTAPSRVAIVPTGQGRPGRHPLAGLVAAGLPLAPAPLSAAAQVPVHGREVRVDWLRVTGSLAGESVLVVDDTWVSGASAQSAAVALKLAGAARVAVIVLGRHVNPASPRSAALVAALAGSAAPPGHECPVQRQ
jgi:hypothetical protein